jgi:hypothetical protein
VGRVDGLGDRVRSLDVPVDARRVEDLAEDAVHAISVAMDALPRCDLHCSGEFGTAAMMGSWTCVRTFDRNHCRRLASCSATVVGQRRRFA